MIKKALIAVACAGLLSAFLFGRDAASYVRTSAGWVKDSVKNSVPIEFEIDRARKMVENLKPEIRKNLTVIATEEVEVARLEKQIAASESRLEKDQQVIMRRTADLKSGANQFEYNDRTYSVEQVKLDVSNRFTRYKTQSATLEAMRDIYQARQQSLQAAQQKLEGMLATKRQLEVEVENLEARLKMLEAAQTTSEYSFDDSRLSRAKALITDLRNRLEVEEKLIQSEGALHDEIPLEEEAPDDIADQVTSYFAEHPEVATVAATDVTAEVQQ